MLSLTRAAQSSVRCVQNTAAPRLTLFSTPSATMPPACTLPKSSPCLSVTGHRNQRTIAAGLWRGKTEKGTFVDEYKPGRVMHGTQFTIFIAIFKSGIRITQDDRWILYLQPFGRYLSLWRNVLPRRCNVLVPYRSFPSPSLFPKRKPARNQAWLR